MFSLEFSFQYKWGFGGGDVITVGGIAVAGDGSFYVTDIVGMILKFDPEG